MSAVRSSRNKITGFGSLLHPIESIKKKYEATINTADFKAHYAERNNVGVITPFLDGLEAEYLLIHQLLLVRESEGLCSKLNKLAFLSDGEINNPIGFNSTQLPARFYHKGYNIEIFVQPLSGWSIVTTANIITNNLKVIPVQQTNTFLSVYDSLHSLLKTPEK
jgi:hypothetical protein